MAAATGLAALVVFRHLGTKPLWLDEAVSVSVAGRHLGGLLSVLPHQDANAGLYYLVLHGWLRLGHGAAFIRAPSAVAFVITAGLAAWAGCRRGGIWLGTALGLLVVTNRQLVFYGQEARPYAISVLFAAAATAALLADEERPAARCYVAATVAALYTNLFAGLFVGAQGLAVIVGFRRRGRAVPPVFWRCWIAAALAALPLAALMVGRERAQISWVPRPSFAALRGTVVDLGNGAVGLAVLVGLALLAVAEASSAVPREAGRRWPGADPRPGGGPRSGGDRPAAAGPGQRRAVAVLGAAFVVPPLVLWSVGQAVPTFVDRYIVSSALGIIGLAALGVAALRRWAGATAAALALAVAAAPGAVAVLRLERAPFKYENPPAVVATITGGTQAGDAVGFGGGGLRTVIDLYRPPGSAFPTDISLAAGPPGGGQRVYAPETDAITLRRRLAGVTRLWLVTDPSDHRYPSSGPLATVRSTVLSGFRVGMAWSSPGIDVTLYVRSAPTRP